MYTNSVSIPQKFLIEDSQNSDQDKVQLYLTTKRTLIAERELDTILLEIYTRRVSHCYQFLKKPFSFEKETHFLLEKRPKRNL